MSLVGFKARNHGQQVSSRGALEKVDDRRTPRELWNAWDREFRFSLDAAASSENALCPRWFGIKADGLSQTWRGERVWCNPPYSDCPAWVAKAHYETAAELIAMLLPANRTEQRWWQDFIEPHRDERRLSTRFLPGRIRFDTPPGTYSDPRGNRPPFGCVLVIWRNAWPSGSET